MDKLGRNYRLNIQPAVVLKNYVQTVAQQSELIQVERPFTLEFDIQQATMGASREATFRVYNLSENRRASIRKDQIDYSFFRKVFLDAGYGANMPNIFTGNILQAWSVRNGVDFITQIIAQGYGYATVNGRFDLPFSKGTKLKTVIETMVKSLQPLGIATGIIGNYEGELLRGNSYSGNTIDILNALTGGGFFIYNGKAYCLKDNEAFTGELTIINSDSGLIGTPVREQTFLYLDMIFEPRLQVGQWVELQSITGDGVNDVWKVVSLKHRGMISETVSGSAITSVGLCSGTAAINKL